MTNLLFRFVKQAASLAQKRCAASPTAVSDPTGNGFPGWKHVTLHFLRVHMDATYREIVDWASDMDRVRGLLQLSRTAFPASSTLYRSFERVPMSVWRGFLRESANICDPGSHGAIDATFFDRETASRHYQHRSNRQIRTLKMTALADTDSCAILDLHCSAHWPHDTQTGRRVALRNTEKIESLAGDKGYDDQSLRDALRSEGVRPLLRHRLFAHYDHAHNARLDSELYRQRWMAETTFSAIKRRFGPAVHPRAWYREFRKLVLTAAVYNLERALKQ
ncbi:IS5/IS1182 family transposase [Haloferax sp. Atlit-10N]|uniref:IS5 family transposase n=1 Tax=Haloferacaceae TaxID=1644056 RepID=UPI00071E867D|nr:MULTISPECIES: IS5 family transposase [Haloferacaceae]RDZ55765.1 IS5/IS1182 family transposase [Haloferax sp. Atlit-10N]